LESTAKEYPAGLIADDGRAQATAPHLKHIGPIDPDAFTLNQFLNGWPYARLRMFPRTAERIGLRSLRTAALNASAGPPVPDSWTGDQERDVGSPTRTDSPLLKLRLNARGG